MGEPPKLLDRVRREIRVRHYSLRTEETCVAWFAASLCSRAGGGSMMNKLGGRRRSGIALLFHYTSPPPHLRLVRTFRAGISAEVYVGDALQFLARQSDETADIIFVARKQPLDSRVWLHSSNPSRVGRNKRRNATANSPANCFSGRSVSFLSS